MRQAIGWGIKILLLVALAVWLADRPGNVRIVWGEWIINSSIGFTVTLMIFLCLLAVLINNFWHRIINFQALSRDIGIVNSKNVAMMF